MNRQRGFTLMEIMIALLVGAIVVAPLYIITKGIAQSTDRQRMEVEVLQQTRVAMDALVTDFQRAGLGVSPNPERDTRSRSGVLPGSHAQYRHAVVHLNRLSTGVDSVLLTGNFAGSRVYQAAFSGSNQVRVFGTTAYPAPSAAECLAEFSDAYAFAHVIDPSGRTVDAEVDDVTSIGADCIVSLRQNDLVGISTTDNVWVVPNQTAYFHVVDVDESFTRGSATCTRTRRDLVRDFLKYDGTVSNASCSGTALPGAIAANTRKVVAQNVQDFQVWFRLVSQDNGGTLTCTAPHYFNVADLSGRLTLSNAQHAFSTPSGFVPAVTVKSNDLACASFNSGLGYDFGPEHVRGALIKLTLRSEEIDPSISFEAFDGGAGVSSIVAQSLAPEQDPDPECRDAPRSAYRLKTMTTEVSMAPLAARSDIIL